MDKTLRMQIREDNINYFPINKAGSVLLPFPLSQQSAMDIIYIMEKLLTTRGVVLTASDITWNFDTN